MKRAAKKPKPRRVYLSEFPPIKRKGPIVYLGRSKSVARALGVKEPLSRRKFEEAANRGAGDATIPPPHPRPRPKTKMKHDAKKKEAFDAVDALHADTSVSMQITYESLKELQEHIESLIDATIEELQRMI